MALNFNDIGPAQSEALYHFTGRIRPPSPGVPQEIRDMTPVERLGAILRDELIRGFAPYRADMPCVCWSESPPDHLAHLIEREGFSPWGVVAVRSALLAAGGGAVAYLPTSEQEKLRAAGFGHWAVRTDEGSMWMHEQEWRLPVDGGAVGVEGLHAILIGNPDWRPPKVETGWVDGATGEPLPGPLAEHAEPVLDYPRLWRTTAVWVWNSATRMVDKYPAGTLL